MSRSRKRRSPRTCRAPSILPHRSPPLRPLHPSHPVSTGLILTTWSRRRSIGRRGSRGESPCLHPLSEPEIERERPVVTGGETGDSAWNSDTGHTTIECLLSWRNKTQAHSGIECHMSLEIQDTIRNT